MLGELLPDAKDKPALKATEIWRVFYFYFPCGLYLLTLISLIFFVKYDSIKHLVTTGQIDEAKKHLIKVYKYCNEKNVDLYVEKIRINCGDKSSNLTLQDALTDPRYRRATWVNIGYITFHELTGINVILQFSNSIFT